ncbi:MAG: hypothetical protein ACE5EF_05480 [Dehalococcoidia bacterium]
MADTAPVEFDEDFYAVLNIPRTVGLPGLQNAYARLSDDLAGRMGSDPTARDELIRLNRAFGVLGNADLREQYDSKRFADDYESSEEEIEREERRGRLLSNLLFGALVLVVGAQIAVIGYFGRTELADAVQWVADTFIPTGAS